MLGKPAIATSHFLYQDTKAYRNKWSNLPCTTHPGLGPGTVWLLWDAHKAIVGWCPQALFFWSYSRKRLSPGKTGPENQVGHTTWLFALLHLSWSGHRPGVFLLIQQKWLLCPSLRVNEAGCGKKHLDDLDVLPAPLSMYHISWLKKKKMWLKGPSLNVGWSSWEQSSLCRQPRPLLSVLIAPELVCSVLLKPCTQFYFPPTFTLVPVKHPHLSGCLQNLQRNWGREQK